MITAILVVVLLATREAVRLTRRDAPAVRIVDRMLVPACVGLIVVIVARVVALVAASA